MGQTIVGLWWHWFECVLGAWRAVIFQRSDPFVPRRLPVRHGKCGDDRPCDGAGQDPNSKPPHVAMRRFVQVHSPVDHGACEKADDETTERPDSDVEQEF